MNTYLKALKEHNGYKLFDDEMEEQMSKTNMADEIRQLCGINKTGNSWFTRDEAVIIARRLNKSAQFISNKKDSHTYIPSKKVFEQYLNDIWTPQATDNMHPNLINMTAIRDALKNRSELINVSKKSSRVKKQVKASPVIELSKGSYDSTFLVSKVESMLDRAKKIKISPSGEIEFWLE